MRPRASGPGRVTRNVNLLEYCRDCGALVEAVPGTSQCPHCGSEVEDISDLPVAPLALPPGIQLQLLEDSLPL